MRSELSFGGKRANRFIVTISNLSATDYSRNGAASKISSSAFLALQTTSQNAPDSVYLTGNSGLSSSDATYSVDPQIAAYIQRMKSDTDPKFLLYDNVLTASDKEMLSKLNGGNWETNGGPASLLTDQIAAARADGSLTGSVTASFIQGIVGKQGASDAINRNQPQAEISKSILNEALAWISDNKQSIS